MDRLSSSTARRNSLSFFFQTVMPSIIRTGLCYSWSALVLQSVLSSQWGWICVIWEGVCVSMYVLVLYVLHVVQDGLTSVGAILEEVAPEWKLQGLAFERIYRHADHLYTKTLNNYLQLPVNLWFGMFSSEIALVPLWLSAHEGTDVFSVIQTSNYIIQRCSIWDTCVHICGFVCAWLCMCERGCMRLLMCMSMCVCVFM